MTAARVSRLVSLVVLLVGAVGASVVGTAATVAAQTAPTTPPTYWTVTESGGVHGFGAAPAFPGAVPAHTTIVAMAATPTGKGYWLVSSGGGIFTFGDAGYFGSTGAMRLGKPIVAMAATPTGKGYWLVSSGGGIFTFGDAGYFGSTGGVRLAKPIVGMAPTSSGLGYWLVAADGGIFTFGDASYLGSAGGSRPAPEIVGMTPTPTGLGYWLLSRTGGIYTFGDAPYRGAGGISDGHHAVAMAATHSLDPFTPGTTGADISWPQCGHPFPAAPTGPAIVGVTGGKAFTENPCVAAEAAWARTGTMALYMNVNSPSVNHPENGATGPAGTCADGDSQCHAYNYGYNDALAAYSYAASVGVQAPMWWLDVEGPAGSTRNLWSTDLPANGRLVAGAIAALTAQGVEVGVYSTPLQWGRIAGTYAPAVPSWQAGARDAASAATYCSPDKAFTAGPIWLVQFAPSPFDNDYAC